MKLEGLNVLLTLDFDTSEFALLIYLKLLLLEFKFLNINKHQSHTRPQNIYIYLQYIMYQDLWKRYQVEKYRLGEILRKIAKNCRYFLIFLVNQHWLKGSQHGLGAVNVGVQ